MLGTHMARIKVKRGEYEIYPKIIIQCVKHMPICCVRIRTKIPRFSNIVISSPSHSHDFVFPFSLKIPGTRFVSSEIVFWPESSWLSPAAGWKWFCRRIPTGSTITGSKISVLPMRIFLFRVLGSAGPRRP